ncbi:MAG: TraQ conjugal transfer family protein, partial [Maribacter sp.]
RGYFLNMEGDTLRQNDTLNIKNSNWAFNYVAIDTGAHRVKFTAWDSNLRIKELDLLYNAKFASFSFLLTKGVNEFIINSKNPINVTLLRDKETENPENKSDFEVMYQIENGTGKLYLGNEIFDAGKPFNLPKGISELGYLPETLGEHKLIFTSKAPDGATLTEELILNVLNLGFTIKATASSTQVELDTNLAIAIDLTTQDEESEVEYEITHSFSNTSYGGGKIRDHNGGVMDPGQYRTIVPNSYNYTFTSEELGKRRIFFDIRDSNGQIKRDSVEIEVANIPFTFSGNSESNSVFVNERSQFNFNIKSNGNTENIKYNLTYEILEGNGRVTGTNGNNIQNSTDYPVDLGNFSLFYYTESLGSHQISFLVTDNYGQEVGPVIIDLETKQNDFQVNITPSKTSEFANIPVNVIIDIDEIPNGANDTYEAFYSSGRNSALRVNGTKYGPGEKFQLRPNSNNVVYTGTEAGQHDIVLSVESDAGVTHTANTSITYNQVDFLFTGGSQKSDISVGEITSLNFNISESIGSSDYIIRYSMNGNALIKNENGNVVSAGNIYDVPKGNFNWSLEGTDESNINLTFYVQNDTGLEKTVTLAIDVTSKNYNFTANATRSRAFTGDVVDITFNISELGIGGDTYLMYFSSGSSNGSFEYNDAIYAAGESFS